MHSNKIAYVWIDDECRVLRYTESIKTLFNADGIREGDDARELFYELHGMEAACRALYTLKDGIHLEAIERNGRYFDFDVFRDNEGLLLTVSDVTASVSSARELLQVRNENALLIARLDARNRELQSEITAAVETVRRSDLLLMEQSRFAMMGEMIANIAHQWRQPLNTLNLLLYGLKDAYEYEELDQAFIDDFYEKCETLIGGMSQTIDDFRHFFEPVSERKPFVLGEAVRKATAMISPLLENAGVSVQITIPPEYVIGGFENQFIQILLNLFGNSLDAFQAGTDTNSERRIELQAVSSEGRTVLRVEDTAGGIDKAIIAHVFDPYFTSKGDNGTGLGLYMAKVIMENNFYGTLSVHNGSKGACFVLSLPPRG